MDTLLRRHCDEVPYSILARDSKHLYSETPYACALFTYIGANTTFHFIAICNDDYTWAGDIGEVPVMQVKQRKGCRMNCDVNEMTECCRMSCDVGEATEWLKNKL